MVSSLKISEVMTSEPITGESRHCVQGDGRPDDSPRHRRGASGRRRRDVAGHRHRDRFAYQTCLRGSTAQGPHQGPCVTYRQEGLAAQGSRPHRRRDDDLAGTHYRTYGASRVSCPAPHPAPDWATPVVEEGHVVGIVSRRDLLRPFDRSDEAIAADIRSTLDDPLLLGHGDQVAFSVREGLVTLTGTVDFPHNVSFVHGIIASIAGVVG